ncbi:11335_t:CDS:2, partial [Dentiscutata heterogama]
MTLQPVNPLPVSTQYWESKKPYIYYAALSRAGLRGLAACCLYTLSIMHFCKLTLKHLFTIPGYSKHPPSTRFRLDLVVLQAEAACKLEFNNIDIRGGSLNESSTTHFPIFSHPMSTLHGRE